MRIAALSEASDVSVATIKFYLREGVLHAGVPTAVNQAEYDDTHVRRLRLIRSLVDLAHLSLADVRAVLAAVDDESIPIHHAFGVAQDAMVPERPRDGARYRAAFDEVDRFVERHHLRVRPTATVRALLADAMVMLAEFGYPIDSSMFDELVPGAVAEAAIETEMLPGLVDRASQMEYSVVGTIAVEVAGAAIRRMALEDASRKRSNR